MKSRLHILRLLAAIFAVATPLSLSAAPITAQSIKPEMPKSVFVYPQNPNQGRDPFFPDSTRPYDGEPKTTDTASLTDLYVKSILQSGTRVFAVINNHTFAPGEDGTVLTRDGNRLSIRCIAIDSKAGAVIVESGGTKAVLHFTINP